MEIPKIFRPSAGFSEVLYRTFQKFYTTSTIELLGFRPSAEKESSIVEKKFYIELYLKNVTGVEAVGGLWVVGCELDFFESEHLRPLLHCGVIG